MTINSNVQTFAGLPVVAFDAGGEQPADPAAVAWRVEVEDFEAPPEEMVAVLDRLLDGVPAEQIRALVIGEWGSAYEQGPPLDLLVSLAPRLTGLRALFLGDLTYEQCEISWINQGPVTPLLTAYPELEVLRVRGAQGLEIEPVEHTGLRELRFESGGLPAVVAQSVGASELPGLRRLDLWLGTSTYGAETTVEDLGPILAGDRLPALRHLALANAEIADEVAGALATAPVVARLEVLDLSKGVLSDTGLQALLAGQSLTHLRRLDLHHHYLSAAAQEQVRAALPGVELDLSEPEDPTRPDDRYVAVGE